MWQPWRTKRPAHLVDVSVFIDQLLHQGMPQEVTALLHNLYLWRSRTWSSKCTRLFLACVDKANGRVIRSSTLLLLAGLAAGGLTGVATHTGAP